MNIDLYDSGVPAVVDFAAMRDAVKRLGGDPQKINPVCPADLVIDHSVQVDVSRGLVQCRLFAIRPDSPSPSGFQCAWGHHDVKLRSHPFERFLEVLRFII